MPASGSEDIPHVLVHDHKIQRPSKSINLEKDKGKLMGLYAVNNPNPSKETLIKAYLSYFEKFDPNPFFLQKAEGLLQNQESQVDELLLAYLKGQHSEVIAISEEINKDDLDAWTCYRVAKSFDKSQNIQKASDWYSIAHSKMKFNLDFGAEYANCLIRNKEIGKAKEILFAQLKIAKKHELTHLNLASCYFIEGQYNDAKKSMLYTLNLNPDNIEACMYLAELHLHFGENDKANEYLQRAANIKNLAIGKKSFTIESVKRLLSK
jgi:tetratricopeptide (TPR) repeat protein